MFTLRVRLVTIALTLFGLLIIARLYHVQVIDGKKYREDAESQYVAYGVDTNDRRDILFTDKKGTLKAAAVMESGYQLADHTVLHGTDGHDISRGAAQHSLGLFADGQNVGGPCLDGYNGRFTQDNALITDVNK